MLGAPPQRACVTHVSGGARSSTRGDNKKAGWNTAQRQASEPRGESTQGQRGTEPGSIVVAPVQAPHVSSTKITAHYQPNPEKTIGSQTARPLPTIRGAMAWPAARRRCRIAPARCYLLNGAGWPWNGTRCRRTRRQRLTSVGRSLLSPTRWFARSRCWMTSMFLAGPPRQKQHLVAPTGRSSCHRLLSNGRGGQIPILPDRPISTATTPLPPWPACRDTIDRPHDLTLNRS